MQELQFSYTDVIAVLSLITSLGALWRFAKEVNKPKNDLVKMVEDHERILNTRKERIKETRIRVDLALRSILALLDEEDKAKLAEIRERIIDFLTSENE